MRIDYIHCLPDQKYKPAIKANTSSLPIKEMTWENFERLCLKLVEVIDGFSISECDILGRKGQKQEGIDIYARNDIDSYNTYQCKRYKKISPKKLIEIFNDFKKGDWFATSKKFILCTSAEFSDTKLQTQYESIKDNFKNEGIEVIRWDSSYLNRILKNHPRVVYDFFGKQWCIDFCGEELYNKHHENFKDRLDANQIAEYKEKLGTFYSHVFNTFDKGLPSLEDSNLKIEDRFVMLDVFKSSKIENFLLEEKDDDSNRETNIDESYINLPFDLILDDYGFETIKKLKPKQKENIQKKILRSRLDAEIDHNSLIIGEAGYGKSTFLRFLILNLLNDTSNSSDLLCSKFGNFIPVYIPFAYLTSKLKENRDRSLLDVLDLWFSSYDKQSLYELVQLAFKDKRLLIVVDGIDEYTSIEIAEIALDKLNIYKENDGIKLILSSRPYGYKILKGYIPKLTILNIAPLSIEQQKNIVRKWLEQKYSDKNTVTREVDDFINELSKANDLKDLAETPLLLNILLVQKLKNLALPKDKFSAYNEITEHLINKHYQKRINSASAEIESSLSELRDYWKDIFSIVAFEFQRKSFDGVLTKTEVKNVVKSFLDNELGYPNEKKIRIANKFTEFGVNHIGILVEKSNDELAFIHRQFQEFLTANHLSKNDTIEKVLLEFSDNLQWEQSIIFFFNHIVSKNQFKNYIEIVKTKNELLAYKIALSNKNCPLEVSRANFEDINSKFKLEQIHSKKDILLNIILLGISNPKLNSEYINFVDTYVPNSFNYQDYRVTPLANIEGLESDKIVIDFLFDHLLNGYVKDKLNASKILQKACKNEDLINRLIHLSYNSTNLYTRAYAINSLLNDYVDKTILHKIIKDYSECLHSEIAYMIISTKVFLGVQSDDDLELLFSINKKINTYELEDEIFWLFTNGWKNSKKLKEKCIEIINNERDFNSEISLSDAWMLLFHNFNKDNNVINRLASEIVSNENLFSIIDNGHRIIEHIGFYFKENKIITNAIVERLNRENEKFLSREKSLLCLISKDSRLKRYIIDYIKKNERIDYWLAYVLLENWKDDNEVKDLIKGFLNDEKLDGSLCILTPKILNKNEGIKLCEKILFGDYYFSERALKPLIEFDREYFEKKLLKKFINNRLEKFSKTQIFQPFWTAFEDLTKFFPDNIDVQNLINKYIDQSHRFFNQLISSKTIDKKIIHSILKKSRPLPDNNRKSIIKEICNHEKYNHVIQNFELESDSDCKTLLAYNFYKRNSLDIALEKAEKLTLFPDGFREVDVAIGLLGYVSLNELDNYFRMRNEKGIKYRFNFYDTDRAFGLKDEYFKYLDIHFEHFSKIFQLESNKNILRSVREEDNLYKLLIRHHSDKFISKPYIFKFVQKNDDIINTFSYVNFLLDEYPNHSFTDKVVIDIIKGEKKRDFYSFVVGSKIGKTYAGNESIKNLLIENINLNEKVCLSALLIGWNKDPIIDIYYKKDKNDELNIDDRGIIYLLMFSRYSNDGVISLLKRIENSNEDVFVHQPHLINPLMYKINEEIEIQDQILDSLLKEKSNFMIVLYFSILKEVNYKSDKLNDWLCEKSNCNKSNLIIGYNIIENKYQSLTHIINQ
ncbi:hypothetical protein IMCC3317_11200 [Kordia antarctica]|uniref:NACHT domain-containing protein n=1 Tax=Kordia antarctica TaxID=1218801 RepID=A0A7L4ZGJ9_9FLAO|nr:NACHT domain-containing protein [Kordia antarctica]QHI35772.1 hypothetical protein IMCC3317_11200 [Kordia antarctica]